MLVAASRPGLLRLYSLRPTTTQRPKMGIMMSKIFETLFGSKEVRILILGLDNAGKTTILYRLQNESDEAVQTIPTIGFNVETLQYKNIKVGKTPFINLSYLSMDLRQIRIFIQFLVIIVAKMVLYALTNFHVLSLF